MVLSLVFVHAYNLGWSPVYDCKPHLETNKIQNCSYFGFGGFFGLREQPIKPAFQHFKTMVNPSIECNSLTKRLLRAKSAVFAGDRDQISNVNKLDSALEEVINSECEVAKISSRTRWIEEGEKPAGFFFRLERKRAEKDIFEFLFNESGEEKCSHNNIELILVDFFKALFSKDSLNMQIQTEILDDLDLSLFDAEQEQCEGLFTKDELFPALKGFRPVNRPVLMAFLSNFIRLSGICCALLCFLF